MPLVRIPTEFGAILYDPSRIDHPREDDFDPVVLAAARRIEGAARGRGSVWFVAARSGSGSWVLRHYRRGGLIARLVKDWYVWCGAAATRSFRELRLLEEIEALGLPAVRAVAGSYRRAGFGYRADLLTVAVAGSHTLASLLAATPTLAPWRRVGVTIRAFHDAGICHADLNAHNVLVDAQGDVWLLDFDRGSRRPPGPWRRGNLKRLRRSLDKLAAQSGEVFAAGHWAALESGYEAPRSAPPR